MDPIPATKEALVLRTDFSDDAAWDFVCAAITQLNGDFQAYVTCISDPQYADLTSEQLPSLVPFDQHRTFAFIVDRTTLSHTEYPVLVVDLHEQPGRTFRVIPSEAWSVENNLSLANVDFGEFVDAADGNGIFRGFSES